MAPFISAAKTEAVEYHLPTPQPQPLANCCSTHSTFCLYGLDDLSISNKEKQTVFVTRKVLKHLFKAVFGKFKMAEWQQ